MTFTDELRNLKNAPMSDLCAENSVEKHFFVSRLEDIENGAFVSGLYELIKQALIEEVRQAKLLGVSPANRYSATVIYDRNEYRKKEAAFNKKYRYRETDAQTEKRSEKQMAYLDYYLPHCVFSKQECIIIETQLSKLFLQDGFEYSFEVKEFKYKIYDGLLGLGKERKSYGYTIEFALSWKW